MANVYFRSKERKFDQISADYLSDIQPVQETIKCSKCGKVTKSFSANEI
jgi:hypothetical protein